MKYFLEALKDGYRHIRNITDPQTLQKLRKEGILVDDEGYYSFTFGDHKEYELAIEPIDSDSEEDDMYFVSLYKNRVLITERLPIWKKK